MNTFLPYKDFHRSAEVLDSVRRWKQCVEVQQILKTLEGKSDYSKNHPACLMWVGYEPALRLYFNEMLSVVLKRKTHSVTMYTFFDLQTLEERNPTMPPWLGDERLHSSHRCSLLRKDIRFYSQYNWEEEFDGYKDVEYFWPVTKEHKYEPSFATMHKHPGISVATPIDILAGFDDAS